MDISGWMIALWLVWTAIFIGIGMWLERQPRKPSKRELARQRRAKELTQLAEWFPIGREFDYLGLRMRVWSHLQWSWDDSDSWPALMCEYVAGSSIKRHTLSMAEAEALHKQQAAEVAP